MVRKNGNGIWDNTPADRRRSFGVSNDIPVSGNWNGAGKIEIGFYRHSTGKWMLDYNGNGIWDNSPADKLSIFGMSTDKP
jgi:hypothetical protein